MLVLADLLQFLAQRIINMGVTVEVIRTGQACVAWNSSTKTDSEVVYKWEIWVIVDKASKLRYVFIDEEVKLQPVRISK